MRKNSHKIPNSDNSTATNNFISTSELYVVLVRPAPTTFSEGYTVCVAAFILPFVGIPATQLQPYLRLLRLLVQHIRLCIQKLWQVDYMGLFRHRMSFGSFVVYNL